MKQVKTESPQKIMVQEKTTNLFDVVLVIGRQYPPRLHRGHRFVDLAILARAHIAGVRVIPGGRDAGADPANDQLPAPRIYAGLDRGPAPIR